MTDKQLSLSRRQSSLGCHSCVKRRVKCDGTRPSCEKCLQKGIECPGYGARYKFYQQRPTSAQQGEQSQSGPSTCESAQALLWPDGSYTARQPSVPETTSTLSDPGAASPGQPSDSWSLSPVSWSFDSIDIPQALDSIDPSTRGLFDHFSASVAPVMVVVDSDFNGYRSLLLPLATADETVRAAVCVASMNYLSQQNPAVARHADLGLQHVLSQLRRRTSSTTDLVDLSAWATVIILLTAETITGGSNFPSLFKVLQHLAAANMETGRTSILHTFLAEQTRMMSLFAQPLLQEQPGTLWQDCRTQSTMDFISNIAILRPDLSAELEIYKSAIRIACDLYVTRATLNPCHSYTVPELENLKVMCELVQPNTPGHHTLVWTYFIAAAESWTFEHRQFFTTRLQEVYSRTRFHNIPAALNALHEIWKIQAERRWTEVLPSVMPVFII